jgi:DNA-binding SARP family transcriptional activator
MRVRTGERATVAAETVEFLILGPVEVREGTRELRVAGTKPRALLAALLLNANRALPSDALIDRLWDDAPPDTASKALQVYVSQLRKSLDPSGSLGLILTRARGYELRIEPAALDLHRFEEQTADARALVAAGDRAGAASAFAAALGLWRGPALGDLASEAFVRREAARLEELRLAAVEDRLDNELALGRHAACVPDLEVLVRGHPLRERPRALHMLALYRSGRQAEALEAYQAARHTLVEELGIEPSRALQDLERAILTHDTELDLPAAQQVTAPTQAHTPGDGRARPGRRAAGVFVGRSWELGELEAALADARDGRGRLVLLTGEQGMGKTALADEFASRAKAADVQVLWARCRSAADTPSLWPWTQLLRSHARAIGAEESRALAGDGDLGALTTVLPELAPEVEGASRAPPFRLAEALASYLGAASRERPLVLVLDDADDADAASLEVLALLATHIPELRVVLLATQRDEHDESPLADVARQGARSIRVGPFRPDDVAGYVDAATGVVPSGRLVSSIRRETGGTPALVAATVRRLAAEGRLAGARR